MTYDRALELAQRCANRTGSSTLVYLATHNLQHPEEVRYGYDFTLPTWGKRIGNRIYPNGFDESSQEDFEEANRNAVLNHRLPDTPHRSRSEDLSVPSLLFA